MEDLPLIFDIRHGALDDGPGIRTTVFLKGCPLSCDWCHNPESQNPRREMSFRPGRCIGCGACADACPEKAVLAGPGPRIDRKACTACGSCADACSALAIETVGKRYSPGELFELLGRDRLFYEASGGGVTFSGGEPTLHMEYLRAVMERLKNDGIHTAIQTCGYFDHAEFREKLLPVTDLVFFDLKFIDPVLHRRHTGRDNGIILANFKALANERGVRLVPCVPLVPAITAVEQNLTEIAAFIGKAGCAGYRLQGYNPLGLEKRTYLGAPPARNAPESFPDRAGEDRWRTFFADRFNRTKLVLQTAE